MQSTRWLTALGAILVVNTVLVLATSGWHLTVAGEQSATSASGEETKKLVESPALENPPVAREPEATQQDPRKDLAPATAADAGLNQAWPAELAVPEFTVPELPAPELPDVPSLDPDALERDPIFRGLKEIFETRTGDPLDASLPSSGGSASQPEPSEFSVAYYEDFGDRLSTVQKLVDGARCLTKEASRSASRSKHRQAADLMRMAEQLRSMAAQLLTDPNL